MKPGGPPLQSRRLLEQVRERARYLHYSLSTEKVYLYWVRFFIRWHGLRHTMIYTQVLKVAGGGTASPLDALSNAAAPAPPVIREREPLYA